jgi:hypothetical protein
VLPPKDSNHSLIQHPLPPSNLTSVSSVSLNASISFLFHPRTARTPPSALPEASSSARSCFASLRVNTPDQCLLARAIATLTMGWKTSMGVYTLSGQL